jgi:hypothetical protein
MTASTHVQISPACPKCSGPCWDQKAGKFWGTGLFKSGKQKPRWECKNKECGGVLWDNEPTTTKAPTLQAHPAKEPFSHANKPEKDLPPYLRDAETEDNAELASKIAPEKPNRPLQRAYADAQKDAVKFVLDEVEPLFRNHEIGMTDDTVHKLAFELFKTWTDKGLIG